MAAPLTTVTVHRPTWGRCVLLSRAGERCCLGFAVKQCGVPDTMTRGRSLPRNILDTRIEEMVPEWLLAGTFLGRPCLVDRIASVNDSIDPDREAALITLFAEAGVTLVFTDEPEAV